MAVDGDLLLVQVALMVSRQRTVDVHAITCVEVLEIKVSVGEDAGPV